MEPFNLAAACVSLFGKLPALEIDQTWRGVNGLILYISTNYAAAENKYMYSTFGTLERPAKFFLFARSCCCDLNWWAQVCQFENYSIH